MIFLSISAARLPGSTFFLQTLAFYRVTVVSPARVRFPVTIGLHPAIGHRAVVGKSSSPGRITAVCRDFSHIRRRTERYP
jgi:hypothetical protein